MSDSKLDKVWNLEGFVTQQKAEPSLKFGFIGIGQAGGKMVDAFAAIKDRTDKQIYPCVAINTNIGDMKALKNIPQEYQLALRGYENGVGKDPEVGRKAFEENGEYIFERLASYLADTDIVFVAASLGGGTGSGSIAFLSNIVSQYLGKPVIDIAALPRPNEVESINAYNSLEDITSNLQEYIQLEDGRVIRSLEGLVILDNEKIWQDHNADPETTLTWDYYSNYKLASIIHEWNVLTSLGSDIVLDSMDILNHVMLTGGSLTYAKRRINLNEIRNKEDLIYNIIETYKGKNVLANGFDYANDLKSMALVVVMPKDNTDINQDTLEMLRTKAAEQFPDVPFYAGFAQWGSKDTALVYTMSSINGLPERAKNLRNEAIALKEAREQREQSASGFSLGNGGKIESKTTPKAITNKKPLFNSKPSQPFTKPTTSNEPKAFVNPFKKS